MDGGWLWRGLAGSSTLAGIVGLAILSALGAILVGRHPPEGASKTGTSRAAAVALPSALASLGLVVLAIRAEQRSHGGFINMHLDGALETLGAGLAALLAAMATMAMVSERCSAPAGDDDPIVRASARLAAWIAYLRAGGSQGWPQLSILAGLTWWWASLGVLLWTWWEARPMPLAGCRAGLTLGPVLALAVLGRMEAAERKTGATRVLGGSLAVQLACAVPLLLEDSRLFAAGGEPFLSLVATAGYAALVSVLALRARGWSIPFLAVALLLPLAPLAQWLSRPLLTVVVLAGETEIAELAVEGCQGGMDRIGRPLRDLLAHGDPAVRQRAAELLAASSPECAAACLDPLLEALGDPVPGVRRGAAAALRMAGPGVSRRSSPALQRALEGEQDQVTVEALVEALGWVGGDGVDVALLGRLCDDRQGDHVRRLAAAALGRHGARATGGAVRPYIVHRLDQPLLDPLPEEEIEAVLREAGLTRAELVAIFAAVLGDSGSSSRRAVVRVFAKTSSLAPDLAAAALPLLEDPRYAGDIVEGLMRLVWGTGADIPARPPRVLPGFPAPAAADGRAGGGPAGVPPVLLQALAKLDEPWDCVNALRCIYGLGLSDPEGMARFLRGLLANEQKWEDVTTEARRLLAAIESHAADARPRAP